MMPFLRMMESLLEYLFKLPLINCLESNNYLPEMNEMNKKNQIGGNDLANKKTTIGYY